MRKITLTDNSGRWFDADAAKRWDEATVCADDGTPISVATRNSWEHETVFLTRAGTIIMHCVNERNPTLASFVEYDTKQAIQWLLQNGYPDDVAKWEYKGDMEASEC
jgi:hypothetical protein